MKEEYNVRYHKGRKNWVLWKTLIRGNSRGLYPVMCGTLKECKTMENKLKMR